MLLQRIEHLTLVTSAPFIDESRNTATIVAEVSAAAAVQVSKEFRRMHEPKITKLRSGYSADADVNV